MIGYDLNSIAEIRGDVLQGGIILGEQLGPEVAEGVWAGKGVEAEKRGS